MNDAPLFAIMTRARIGLVTLLVVLFLPSSQADDWPMFRYDETHQGQALGNTVFGVFEQQWWNNLSIPSTIKGSPVVKDGRVYLGTWDNQLWALDSESGSVLWRNSTSGKITGTPAVSEQTVYVATESGTLHAFNARTGAKEREVSIGSGTFGSPVVHERRVFIGTGTGDQGGKVVAYEGDTLTKIWEFPVSGASGPNGRYFNQTVPDGQVEVTPAVYNGQVLFGSTNQYFYSVSEQGIGGGKTTLTWLFKATGSIRSSPAIDKTNSRVLFGAQDGKLYSVSLASTGFSSSAAWTWQENAGVGLPSQIQSSPAIAGGHAIVGANNGNIIAVSLTAGTRTWARATEGQVVSSPAVANGLVLIGSSDRNIYMLNVSDGAVRWSKPASAAIESSPAIAGTQGFWVGTDGSLYSWGGVKPQRADLKIAGLSGVLVQGQTTVLVLSISNVGQLDAPETTAQLFQGSQLVGTATVSAVPAGQSTSVTFTYTAGAVSSLAFRAVLDPTNQIREVDESNNVLSQTMSVSAPAPTPPSAADGSPGPGWLLGVLVLLAVGAFARRRAQP